MNLNLPSEFEFAVVGLPQWIWICRGEFELALVNLNLPWKILICCSKFEFCCGEFEFAVVNLKLPQWIWICHGEFEFAMVNLNLLWRIWILPWWILNCGGQFEFAVVNLNFQQGSWICRGEFEVSVVNFNLPWRILNLPRSSLYIYHLSTVIDFSSEFESHHRHPHRKFLSWYQEFLCPVEPLYFSDEKSITVEKW